MKKDSRYINCARKWRDTRLKKEYQSLCKRIKFETRKARLIYEQNLVENAKQNLKVLYKSKEELLGLLAKYQTKVMKNV